MKRSSVFRLGYVLAILRTLNKGAPPAIAESLRAKLRAIDAGEDHRQDVFPWR